MAEFDQAHHARYYPKLAPNGRTLEEWYQTEHAEATLITNVSLSNKVTAIVDQFMRAVDDKLPNMYGWFEPTSWHMTVRALVPK